MRDRDLSCRLAGIALSCVAVLLLALACVSPVRAADLDSALIIEDDQYPLEQRGLVPLPEKVLPAGAMIQAEAANLIQTQAAMSVPVYGQCGNSWSGNQLGTCSLTICDAGCAISSTAMVLKYYGVNADPGSLNSYMKSHGGYSGGCSENWSVAAGMSGGSVTWVASYDWSNVPANLTTINTQLDAGYPVISEVRLSGGMHFVVITGHDGGTYYINDPAYGDRSTLNARYGTPTAACYGIRIYHGNVTPPTPTWAATYHAQSYPATMVAGSTATAWAEYTNTGTGHWAHDATRLGTSSPQDRSSPFYNAGNWVSAIRPSDVDQTDVAQGAVGRFSFILKAPATPGTYVEKFRPVEEGVTWFGDEVTFTITVTASLGNITGTVRNSYNSQPINGATVAISGGPSTSTNASGVYLFTGLAPTTYTLNVSVAGFGSASGTATVTAGATTTKDFSLTSTDNTAPTAPSGLAATAVSPSQINLTWNASTDSGGSGLAGYIVYRGGAEIGRTTATSFANNGLASNTAYSYTVKAYDNAGNVSGASNTASATTQIASVPIFQDGFANTNYWESLVESEMPGPYPPALVADNHDHAQFAGVNSLKTATSTDGKQGCLIGHKFDTAFAAARFESYFFDGTGLGYLGYFESSTEGWASYPSAYGTLTTASGGVSGKCLSISDGGWTGGSYKEFAGGFAVGETYWLSISEKVPAAGTWGTAPYVFVRFLNSSGATIGTDNTAAITVDNAWHAYSLTGTIPAGAAKIWIGQYMYLNATATYTYCVDNVSFITSTDVKTNLSRQGLQVRCIAPDETVQAIYYVGTYNASPGANGKYSAGYYKLGTTGWLWPLAQVRDRSPGWHKFAIDFLPYSGAGNEVHFYIDGVDVGQVERTLNTQTYGLNMVAYGYHYRVNVPGWFDDCAMYAAPPAAPTMNNPLALSSSAIRWNLTDNSNNEMGFEIVNSAQVAVASATVSNGSGGAVSADETGLAPNMAYTRTAKAFNGTLDSSPSASATRWTLSMAPSTSSVTCDHAAGSWSSSPDFAFTAVGGFGDGTVEYYRYAWDTSLTHAWSGSEATWNSGELILSAPASGSYYLHVKGYNGEDVPNGVLDLGPYGYQASPLADKIGSLWPLDDGSAEWLQGKPVTAAFSGAFYVEEPDRTAGIMVVSSATVARGDLVNVEGNLGLTGVQRAFIATYVEKSGTGTVPAPLMMTTRALGGTSPYDQTPGVTDPQSLYNVGLLARVAGCVTYSNSAEPSNKFFYLNDGCGVSDGSGHPGVLVRCGSVSPPSTGMVAVTGVVGLEQAGKRYVPVMTIRDAVDIRAF